MNDNNGGGVHWSFWAIGAVTLIWNVMGAINFFVQLNPDMVASFPDSHRAIIEGRPVWATSAFAISVFGGATGCVLLLLRKPIAFYVFVVSLLGTIVTLVHALSLGIEFSASDMVLTILMPFALAAFLIWYSKWAEGSGWIGPTAAQPE